MKNKQTNHRRKFILSAVAEVESQGFDIEEIQYLMNLAGENHDGISWDLIPAGNSV